jgi:predicted kinase
MDKTKLILLSGLPGSGKSTLAEAVARELKLPIFSVDPIESAIIKANIPKSFETGHAAYLVAETLALEQFKLGSSVVIDAVNAEEEAKDVWRNLAQQQKISLVIIECTTSDIKLHKKRIAARVRNLHGIPEITWERVESRRAAYTRWKEPTLKIDTAVNLQENVKKVVEHIQKDSKT